MIRRLALVTALLFLPLVARASTSSCQGVGDGTACTTECISSGVCHSNVCVAKTIAPNGSACSSENKCTVMDTCQNGECVSGGAITCPSTDACNRGECVPGFGCVVVNQCKPDLATPIVDMATTPHDMATTPTDMAMSIDLSVGDMAEGPHDMATIITDACFMPPHSEILLCPGADGPIVIPLDLSGDDLTYASDMAERYGHLRGSRPGDCDVTPGARTTSPLALCLIACALLLLRRRA
jgi:hypothetical protein